jgi:hypothetical protein
MSNVLEKSVMSMAPASTLAGPVQTFSFESFGVRIRIESDHPDLLEEAERILRKALLNGIGPCDTPDVHHIFELTLDQDGGYVMILNGEIYLPDESRENFFSYFDGMIRVSVAEYAVDRTFMHAGVVGWKGKAIVLPAHSYQGKTTLVAELVRNGAVYYTDDYAIFDEEGLVYPFARPLSIRTNDIQLPTNKVPVESLGGVAGVGPMPVGLVLLTGYKPGAKWKPKVLSPGRGFLEMVPYTIAIKYNPDFSMRVLNNVASRAIIASSLRGSAKEFAKTLLNFVDKNVN